MVPCPVPPNIYGTINFNLGPNMQDPYEFCRCGSGKKNRWCCAPLEVEIDKAWRQGSMGQHEGALRTMDSLAAANKENPEVFGRKAELLFALGRPKDALAILDKAFALRSDYPFGNYLKAAVLHDDNEMAGALILARRSLESYHPAAVGPLCRVLKLIFNSEMALNRPIAARVALKRILKLDPTLAEAKSDWDLHFGASSMFVEAAIHEYSLLPPPPIRERQMAWNKAAKAHGAAQLSGMAKMFEELTAADPTDIPASYNSVLTLAWIGNNAKALDALNRYFQLEKDEARLIAAVGLSIVLRADLALSNHADFFDLVFLAKVKDTSALLEFAKRLAETNQFFPTPRKSESQSISGYLLKHLPNLVVSEEDAPLYASMQGIMTLDPSKIHLRCFNPTVLAELIADATNRGCIGANEGSTFKLPLLTDPFRDLALLKLSTKSQTNAAIQDKKQIDFVQNYLVDQWPNIPLKILGDKSPKEAIETPLGKILVLGLVKFIEGSRSNILNLGFGAETFMEILGLSEKVPLLGSSNASGEGALSPNQLDHAFREARHHDNDEEAVALGEKIVALSSGEIADRSHVYLFLSRQKVSTGALDEAATLLAQGADFDRENNEGAKTAELQLAKAQLVSKQGRTDEAAGLVVQTARAHAKDLAIVARATEMLIGMKRAKEALEIGEAGLKVATHEQNRDAEGHLAELVGAAKRLG